MSISKESELIVVRIKCTVLGAGTKKISVNLIRGFLNVPKNK